MVRRARIHGCAAVVVGAFAVAAPAVGCQPGMGTTPAVAPLPARATGMPLFLAPDPTVGAVQDEEGRPIILALQHGVRDVLEEAGFKLAASPEEAGGFAASLSIQRVGVIHADVFIRGQEACGVKLVVVRAGAVVASAAPEVECLSTSTYYGMLPKDAAVALVNGISHAPGLIAAAESLKRAPP